MYRRQFFLLSLTACLVPGVWAAGSSESWSKSALLQAHSLSREAIGHPFLQQVFAGTLSEKIFARYLMQNRIYLLGYARCLKRLSERLSVSKDFKPQAKVLSQWEQETLALKSWTDDYMKQFGAMSDQEALPATAKYMAFEAEAVETQNPAVAMAALLPCFWIYNEFGEALRPLANLKNNPFSEWVRGFGTEASRQGTRLALEVADRLALSASKQEQKRMTEVFLIGCRHELALFDAVYRAEAK